MEQPVLSADSFLDRIALVLCEGLRSKSPDDLAAARAFARLCGAASYRAYLPRKWLGEVAGEIAGARVDLALEATEECAADLETLKICLRTAVGSVVLEDDAVVILEVFQEEERRKAVPRIGLGFSGPGRLPETYELAGRVRLSLQELSDCWTLATRSGRIDVSPNGLDFRLKGERLTPSSLPAADAILKRLPDLEAALAVVEGPAKREAGDVLRLHEELVAAYTPRLDVASIRCESLTAPLPLIILDRGRLRRFFVAVYEYALWNVLRGGTITWLFEYAREHRQISILVTVQGVGAAPAEFHTALMQRMIADAHGGKFEYACADGEASIAAALPDPAGHALDAWLPGWEAFGDQSRQFLRLLKSGGPAPPEELILGGILEQELTRWLMPRLALPLTQNVAGELQPKKAALPEIRLDRLQKSLQQIAKGKAKKDLAAPATVGELVYAFRGTDRARTALGTQALSEGELESFAQALLATPLRALEALRFLARVIGD
jgi:hypothetical protein